MERSLIPERAMQRVRKLSDHYIDWTLRIANTVTPQYIYHPICVWDGYMAPNGTVLADAPWLCIEFVYCSGTMKLKC